MTFEIIYRHWGRFIARNFIKSIVPSSWPVFTDAFANHRQLFVLNASSIEYQIKLVLITELTIKIFDMMLHYWHDAIFDPATSRFSLGQGEKNDGVVKLSHRLK